MYLPGAPSGGIDRAPQKYAGFSAAFFGLQMAREKVYRS
jgi:hypothetical protein